MRQLALLLLILTSFLLVGCKPRNFQGKWEGYLTSPEVTTPMRTVIDLGSGGDASMSVFLTAEGVSFTMKVSGKWRRVSGTRVHMEFSKLDYDLTQVPNDIRELMRAELKKGENKTLASMNSEQYQDVTWITDDSFDMVVQGQAPARMTRIKP